MAKIQRNLGQLKEAWDGLDFILELFSDPKFPRTIATGATSRGQRTVYSRDEAITYFEAALYEDCYMNAYLDYDTLAENGQRLLGFKRVPNHIIIDLDREHFASDDEFKVALDSTLQNIKTSFTGIIADNPIVIQTGNGYHIHVPLPGFSTPLEEMPEFSAFKDDKDLPNKLLRWAERTLSNGKADPRHNPSINSAMFRMPGTINTKARAKGRVPKVRIVQGFEYVIARIAEEKSLSNNLHAVQASKPTNKFLNDFLGYLIEGRLDEKVEKLQRRRYNLIHVGSSNNSNSWIDKLLQAGVGDERKSLIFWVFAPYLITVKNFEYDKAYHIIEGWLEKCDEIRSLHPDWNSFRYRIRYCLDVAQDQERRPIRFETFKEYYPELYKRLTNE